MSANLKLQALMAPARANPEPSRALPRRMYGDPAEHVEFPAEVERQRKANKAKKSRGKGQR